MNTETHAHLAAFIWDICNLLRGPYKRNEYRKVILPLTLLRRLDCIPAPTKQAVLAVHRANVAKTTYDPACGMLSEAEKYIHQLNTQAQPHLFGQDWNDEAWAVCKSDMLIKGEAADNIRRGDSFMEDHFDRDARSRRWTFDYMLANPPFGVTWKQQEEAIIKERDPPAFPWLLWCRHAPRQRRRAAVPSAHAHPNRL